MLKDIFKTKTKNEVSSIVDLARKIADNSNNPMSIDQIKGKFELNFPFSVRKVTNPHNGIIPINDRITIFEFHPEKPGQYLIQWGDKKGVTEGSTEQWVLV